MRNYLLLVSTFVAVSLPCVAQTKTETQKTIQKTEAATPKTAAPSKSAADQAAAAEAAPLKWYAMDEVLALSAAHPKKIFIDVYTDWCGWCKVMDKQTFSDPKVSAYLAKYFYPVKFNAEQKTPITFGDKTYEFKPEYRSHELAVALLQAKMSYPSTVYMDEKGQLLTAVAGFQKPADFLPILVFFAENYYTSMTWENFAKDVWPAKQKEMEK